MSKNLSNFDLDNVSAMSAAKRSRRRPTEGRSPSPQPENKRLKVDKSPRVSNQNGLGFLVDENLRPQKKLTAKLTNGVHPFKSARVDDSRAVVATNTDDDEDEEEDGGDKKLALRKKNKEQEIIDVSSDDESSSLDDEDGDEDTSKAINSRRLANGHVSESEEEKPESPAVAGAQISQALEVRDADAMDEDGPGEVVEPTFGDLLKSQHPDPINIDGGGTDQAMMPTNTGLVAPSGSSLGMVLSQALKTNDRDLLESCFRVTDRHSIRSTIQRLPSQHAATLLQRLAERIHKRPGRTGSLMVWVQWALVAHGAYLANDSDTMRQLKGLTAVIRDRAKGLEPLLNLRGRLDLLSAQLELRQSLDNSSGQAADEDDVAAVRWVEGEDEDVDSYESDEGETVTKRVQQTIKRREGGTAKANGQLETLANGFYGTDEDSSGDEEMYPEDAEDILDIEAEEGSDEEEDGINSDEEEESVDEVSEEEELSEDDDDSDVAVQVPKHNTLNRKR